MGETGRRIKASSGELHGAGLQSADTLNGQTTQVAVKTDTARIGQPLVRHAQAHEVAVNLVGAFRRQGVVVAHLPFMDHGYGQGSH